MSFHQRIAPLVCSNGRSLMSDHDSLIRPFLTSILYSSALSTALLPVRPEVQVATMVRNASRTRSLNAAL